MKMWQTWLQAGKRQKKGLRLLYFVQEWQQMTDKWTDVQTLVVVVIFELVLVDAAECKLQALGVS